MMKISIDGMLSTAIEMKNKKSINNEEASKNEKNDVKTDSFEIKGKVASRLGIIQTELKDLQSSLTKNQIIKEGIFELKDDFEKGNGSIDSILRKVKYENEHILNDFLGKTIDYDTIVKSGEKVGMLIERDISSLKGLQVEIENILASSLVDSNISEKVSDIEHSLSSLRMSTISKISGIKAETVMGLIG